MSVDIEVSICLSSVGGCGCRLKIEASDGRRALFSARRSSLFPLIVSSLMKAVLLSALIFSFVSVAVNLVITPPVGELV